VPPVISVTPSARSALYEIIFCAVALMAITGKVIGRFRVARARIQDREEGSAEKCYLHRLSSFHPTFPGIAGPVRLCSARRHDEHSRNIGARGTFKGQGTRMTAADWINVALAVVTTLMAGGTVYLALYTRNLARETAEGIEQAARHHQEDLRPFCMIEFNCPTDQDPFGIDWNSNSRIAEAKRRMEESSPPVDTIAIRGELRNKGKGLAKDVVAYLNKRLG
jgi:hypothetical protein